MAGSGLATEAVGNLTGESREKTYDAFSLLFLMAKAGEIKPLMQAIEDYPNAEVRIAVVKLLALSGQPEIVPAFRRLAVQRFVAFGSAVGGDGSDLPDQQSGPRERAIGSLRAVNSE